MKLLAALGLRVKQKPEKNISVDPDADDIIDEDRANAIQGPLQTSHSSESNTIRSDYLTTRVLMIIVGVSATINIFQTLALIELIPMHTVQPYLVTFQDASNQIVSIAPPTTRLSSMSIITEKMVREYMVMRYEVQSDAQSNEYRWGTRIKILSSQNVYSGFQAELANIRNQQRQPGFTQSVTIRNILHLHDNTYQIDFDLTPHVSASGLSTTPDTEFHYTAELTISMQPQRVPRSLITLNPFGFVVTSYGVSPRHQ